MLRLGWIVVLLVAGTVAQEHTKTPAQKAQALSAFPAAEAKWTIRGKAVADALLAPKQLVLPLRVRDRLPNGVADETRRCNPQDHSLPGVFVYVAGLEKKWAFEPRPEPRTLTVGKGRLLPTVSGIMTGEWLELRNPFPPPTQWIVEFRRSRGQGQLIVMTDRRGRRFGARLSMNPSAVIRVRFPSPAHAGIVCPSHRWMRGSIHIMRHPVFTVTDDKGRFSLPKLPDGKYDLVAIHALLGRVTQRIEIAGKPRKPVTFAFEVPPGLRKKTPAAKHR